jgi:predicted nucleic acid-binding protein
VRYFFDTSVLVAVVLAQHVHHTRSLSAYVNAQNSACCAAHSLAELYATLTRLPGNHRVLCEQALLLVGEIRNNLKIIPLDAIDYYAAIASAAKEGITGGTTYDVLLARCALKSKATVLFTWNVSHFRRLGPDVARLVRTP